MNNSEELDVLNQFFPNSEENNKRFLEQRNKGESAATTPDFLTKDGSDFPFAEGPLGKQPLPAPKDKAQIFALTLPLFFNIKGEK